jgi:hypothetical protein
MNDPIRKAASGGPLTRRELDGFLAVVAAIAVLAGPRRTRPLAGFLYGVVLSRAQGAARERLENTLLRLFDERNSIGARIDALREGQRIQAEHFDRLHADAYAELSGRFTNRCSELSQRLGVLENEPYEYGALVRRLRALENEAIISPEAG